MSVITRVFLSLRLGHFPCCNQQMTFASVVIVSSGVTRRGGGYHRWHHPGVTPE